MPTDSAELASALKQAKKKPMFFAFIAKGTDGVLLVDKKKIPAKEIAEAKKECGGGTVFTGRCQDEEGTLVFEVAKDPPGPLAGQLKKIIKRDAALTLNVDVRKNEELEGEEEGNDTGETAPPPPPPMPGTDGAIVTKRLNALAGNIKAALTGPNGTQVQTLFGAVNGLIKNKDFAQAGKVLDELEPLVARAIPTAPPPPPVDGSLVTKRLNALAPGIKTAVAGPDSAQVQTLVSTVNGLIKNKDFAQAGKVLDELEPLVNKVVKPTPDQAAAQFAELLKALGELMPQAQTANAALAQQAKLKISEANVFFRKKEYAQANGLLKEADALIEKALATAPPSTSPDGTGFKTAMTAWQTERQKVVGELRGLVQEIKSEGHPESAQAEIELKSVIANLTETPADVGKIDYLKRYLADDDVVADVCEFAFDFRSPLLKLLDALKGQLPKP